MSIVNLQKAKAHLSQLENRARDAEETLIAKRGAPHAKWVPMESTEPWRPGLLGGKVEDAFFEPLPEEILDRRLGRMR